MKPALFALLTLTALAMIPQTLCSKDLTKDFSDPKRKAILDAIHHDIYAMSQMDIVLTVHTLNVENGWAWITARARSKDGKSNYEDIVALLHYKRGEWQIMELPCSADPDEPECFDEKLYNRTLFKMYPKMPRDIVMHR